LNLESLVNDETYRKVLKPEHKRLFETFHREYFNYEKLSTPQGGKYPDAAEIARREGMLQPLLLNDDEFESLVYLPEFRIEWGFREWTWTSIEDVHLDASNCIQEIANEVNSHEAKRWGDRSELWLRRLGKRPLSKFDGVKMISEWAEDIRRLLKAMGRYDLLPRPQGKYPTPTTLDMTVAGEDRLQPFLDRLSEAGQRSDFTEYRRTMREALAACGNAEKIRLSEESSIAPYVKSMRWAIGEFGRADAPKKLFNRVKAHNKGLKAGESTLPNNRQRCYIALEVLTALGEYKGLGGDQGD